MRTVLFLCSGNYYRSRFAEMLFNVRAEAAGLDWRADSRAVRLNESLEYIRGSISPFTVEALAVRGITVNGNLRGPIQVSEADMVAAARIIAMKEAEHREPLEKLFPKLAARVEYWQMHDIDCAEPAECMQQIDAAIDALIAELKAA